MAVVAGSLPASTPAIADSTLTLHLNRDTLLSAGLRVAVAELASDRGNDPSDDKELRYVFRLLPSGVAISPGGAAGLREVAGSASVLGGLLFMHGTTPIDLRHLHLQESDGDATRWKLVDERGETWLTLDHAHPHWDASNAHVEILHANLRLSKVFANAIERPEMSGSVMGGADFTLMLEQVGDTPPAQPVPVMCQAPWPNRQTPAKVELILGSSGGADGGADSISFERCLAHTQDGHLGACTGDVKDGLAVFAPDASLRNIGKSAIPWHGMFTGAFPPYQNDQHPFLIWNLYRIDPDGTFRQLGRSGVKHAFFAVNTKCSCPPGNVVYPQCEDVYSSFSNDSLEFLGPREEVLPAQGIWGRCGSVFDSDCDGKSGPRPPGQDDGLAWRLAVPETELLPSRHAGATYLFEYGYFIRDGQPGAALGYRVVHPKRLLAPNGVATWVLSPEGLTTGLALDRWVRPNVAEPMAMRRSFSTPDGSGSVAVRIAKVGAHAYRYDYAILNLDLVHAKVSGESLNAKVQSPSGIVSVTIPKTKGVEISHVRAWDNDPTGRIDWQDGVTETDVTLRTNGTGVTWGTVLSVSLLASSPPGRGFIRLRIGGADSEPPVEVEVLVPRAPAH